MKIYLSPPIGTLYVYDMCILSRIDKDEYKSISVINKRF